MTKKKCWIWAVAAAIILVCMVTAWVIIHRRAIRAAVKGEPMPACPHWLPGCLREKLAGK